MPTRMPRTSPSPTRRCASARRWWARAISASTASWRPRTSRAPTRSIPVTASFPRTRPLPRPASIAAMGNKAAAKRRMIDAGVPCVPGYQGADQGDANLGKEARKIGLPVMVKAAAGGGGRGMRLVERDGDLIEAIRTARAEAESAFGSGELILEKAVVDARHVEIQVFADAHGNVIHL